MNEESLTQDETGVVQIALKLDGNLRPPWNNLETLFGPQVLADHVGREVTPIKNSQHIGVTDI